MASVYDTPFWSNDFYDHRARWNHYFNQIRAVADTIKKGGGDISAFSMLEVGPSHGLVTGYLRKFGVTITTLDFKPEYSPNVVGDVRAMPFPDNSFDMSIACEVLEHMPFVDSQKAFKELHRVTKRTVLISVPDARHTLFHLRLKIPLLKEIKIFLRVPTFKKQIITNPRGHNWEIGKSGYPVSKIREALIQVGFRIIKSGAPHDTPHNHYFLLEKV